MALNVCLERERDGTKCLTRERERESTKCLTRERKGGERQTADTKCQREKERES